MSPNGKHLYRFSDFSLDVEENVLRRNGKPLPMPPKTFELLKRLVADHGQIVGKDELLKTVWADSFVEKGSITFAINQLRKFLNDNAREPLYIETVPRRGYRFIGEIEEIVAKDKNGLWGPQTGADLPANRNGPDGFLSKFSSSLLFKFGIGIFIVLLGSIFFVAAWYFAVARNRSSEAPILSAPQKTVGLSETGNVFYPRISPDGKYVVYISVDQDKEAVWIRDLETSDNLQLVPYSNDEYLGLMFSPSNDAVYFARRPRKADQEQTAIFRISRIGGVPIKLVENAQGWFSISPEGKIAFVRNERGQVKRSMLMIADPDGSAEKMVSVRNAPYSFRANRWSSDGKSIACAVGESDSGSNNFELKQVDVETGEEREITSRKFFYIEDLDWLPNHAGLLFTARDNFARRNKIWHVSYATGEAEPIRDDSTHYGNVSLDLTSTKMVVGQIVPDFHLEISEMMEPKHVLSTSSDSLVSSFTPTGKIVYSSNINGQSDIWIMNPNATEQRQLTNDPAADTYPRTSPDEKYIFFTSNRSGNNQIWRMNLDGSDQRQITNSEGGNPIFASREGVLYYRSLLTGYIWKVSFDGSGQTPVLDKRVFAPAFSPDGKLLAYFYRETESGAYRIAVVSFGPMQVINTLDQANPSSFPIQLAWASDNKTLFYPSADADSTTSLWRQSIFEKSPQKITDLSHEEVEDFSLSPDNAQYAVVAGKWNHDAGLIKGFR